MEALIFWFIILGIAIYNSKKKKNAKTAGGRQQNYQARPNNNPNMAQMQAQMTTKQRELKNRLQQKYVQAPQNRPMQRPPQNRPMQQVPQPNDIMSRAVANAKENEADELQRSQSVAVMNESPVDVHNMIGVVDITKSSELMSQISDLMIMGYQSDLSFERDFVAEGIDMLNSYEMPEI